MIYDRLDNLYKYKNTNKWLSNIVDFLKDNQLQDLPIGRTEICGNHVFINVMEVETKEEKSVDFEIHKKYLDIQICLQGRERILSFTKKHPEI